MTASFILSGRNGHCCRTNVDGNEDDGGFDRDDDGKEDENKEDNDIDEGSTMAAALDLENNRCVQWQRGVTGSV